jgi:hypothetical protein
MKSLQFFIIASAAAFGIPQAHAITASAGEAWDLQFQSIPLISSMYVGLGPQVTFSFAASNSFDIGDSFKVDYFSDTLDASPDRSITYVGTSPASSQLVENLEPQLFNLVIFNWSSDLQGAMRLTMLTGSIDLTSTQIEVWNGSNYFASKYSFSPSPVPEPSSALLFASVGPLLLWRLRSRAVRPQPGAQPRSLRSLDAAR